MSKRILLIVAFLAMTLVLSGCASFNQLFNGGQNNEVVQVGPVPPSQEPVSSSEPAASATGAGLANPASINCTAKGGTLQIIDKIVKGNNLGQYGICYFEDNRQCEEWALLRGDCPAGGFKVTGYATPAAVYCAITGNTYQVTKEYPAVPADQEEGTCTLKSGKVCDAGLFYQDKCLND